MTRDVEVYAPVEDPPARIDALGDRWPGGGTYTLVLELPGPVTVEVGALGDREFPAGGYAYTGSALGAGGFSRVGRHASVAAGERDVRHWHVDYLAGRPETTLRAVGIAPGADAECAAARAFGPGPVPGFGASDCDCRAHLAHRADVDALVRAVRDRYGRRPE